MRTRYACAPLAFLLALPTLALASPVSVSNHTQVCSYCGDNFFYHADLNNDGNEDLVYIAQPPMNAPTSFVIRFSNGDGTYAPAVSYSVPAYTGSFQSIATLALGDFNHDGSVDVVAFAYESGDAYIFLNNGKGALTLGGSFNYNPPLQSNNIAVTVGDFNHDNLDDLAYIESGQLVIKFGDGKGAFTTGPSMQVLGASLMMGDFDGDGAADLLVYGDNASPNNAYVLFGDRTGHFPVTTTLSMPSGFAAFSMGDVNSDGVMDVMAVDTAVSTKQVFIFYGDSSRKFPSRTNLPVGRCLGGNAAQVADMDGNGLNDVIVTESDCAAPNNGTQWVDVLTRNPNASYNPDQTIYWAQPSPDGNTYSVDMAPVIFHANRDSKPDLLVQQCDDQYCYTHYDTTQLNTTAGAFPACDAPPAASGVNVCTPPSTPVGSPVRFQIGASLPVIARDIEVWVDGKKLAEQIYGFSGYAYLDRTVSLTPGTHQVGVFGAGWDQSTILKTFTVTVQ